MTGYWYSYRQSRSEAVLANKTYLVTLTSEERDELDAPIRKGQAAALVLTRARILLKADLGEHGPAWDDARIAEALDVGLRTIARVRERFVERGVGDALRRKRQDKPSRESKLDGAAATRSWPGRLVAGRVAGARRHRRRARGRRRGAPAGGAPVR